MDILELVPNYKDNNKKIALSLGFRAEMVIIPPILTPVGDDKNIEPNSQEQTVWILRDSENFIWYIGKRIVTKEDNLVEITPALSEEALWNRDCPDFYSDSNMAFSLLSKIPYHSLRVIQSNFDDRNGYLWEISYRRENNGPTYTEVGRFITISIVNVFMECNLDIDPEIELDQLLKA